VVREVEQAADALTRGGALEHQQPALGLAPRNRAMTAYGFATGQFALVLPFVFAFIAAHAIGQGAVIWVYISEIFPSISEIFPSVARAKGQSLGAGTHWVIAAALTLVMPAILAAVSPVAIFLFFAGMMVLQLIWLRLSVVETRGRSLEEVSSQLSRSAS
jgi:hypothetical protein